MNETRLLGQQVAGAYPALRTSLILSALNSGKHGEAYYQFALLDNQGQEQLRLSRQEVALTDNLNNRSR